MKGSITLRNDVRIPYWIVNWSYQGRVYKISKYLGETEPMYQRHPDKKRDIGYKKAEKLLALIQGDEERGMLRIEKYLGEHLADIVPYLEQWLEARRPTLTPGGYKKYKTAVNVHLIPFFRENPIMLHEVRYDTLINLLNRVTGSGKNKKNVVDTLRCCLKYAWKSERILAVPPFPEKELYDIQQQPVEWLPRERFDKVMGFIPMEHKPFFMWLYLHLRRPGEACALLVEDYKPELDAFVIRRGISDGRVIDRTKTGDIHTIPCHDDFKPYMKIKYNQFSPYFFNCAESKRLKDKSNRYTDKIYGRIWREACEKAGETIKPYHGTKTTRASQMYNEEGMSRSDLQVAGDWARYESTEPYAEASLAKKREIIQRKLIPFTGKARGTKSNTTH